ncbi:MAG: Type 1 glutamine amidotransferase-like domain-containing protein [Clostridiaceae bacterium]|nr:Type 1 glutamine amidotransferase-like domain-containing protein [Clostridiaceae bacterium]
MMGMIFAIGGGEIRTGETDKLNSLLISMAQKPSPNLLFLPTASHDAPGYIETVTQCFGGLGCSVKALCLYSEDFSQDSAQELFDWCDIVYVGGGDTVSMMDLWRKTNVDNMLISAYNNGKIMSGLSAGSICWFTFGHSDSEAFHKDGTWDYIKAFGLDLIHAAHCPHYNHEGRESFDNMLSKERICGIALEDGAAFIEENGQYRISLERPEAGAYLLKNQDGKQIKRRLLEGEEITL